MAEDSKLAGHYAPEKHEIDDASARIKSARERALDIASPLNLLAKKI
jgi:hypothetical protein